MSIRLNWGILSTGAIARAFAHGVRQSTTGRLAAVGSRSKASAEAFADELEIAHRHGSYDALLADSDVQAVYIATPHPMHAQWAIRAAEAGKHILCEKPAALNRPQAMAMIQAARQHGVFFMEGYMYRCHPQTARLVELIREGVIGEVQMIAASFGFSAEVDPASRLFDPALGGGGIMDVGGYPVSMSRLIAGAALGRPFADAVKVSGCGHLGRTGVDEWAAGVLQFEGDLVAQVATGVRQNLLNDVRIFGTAGRIEVPDPWLASRGKAPQGRIVVHTGGEARAHEVATELNSFSHEADRVAEAIAAGRQEAQSPAMSWDETLGNLHALDRWRAAVGLVYPDETPEHNTAPVHGRPLETRPDHNMKYGQVPRLDKPVSRLVMGCDNQPTFAHSAVMFDAWIECGGNAFDTAYVYGGGRQERLLGQWIGSRRVRDQVVVIVKGAHTPKCDPENLTRELHESLDRLGTDHADIYMMHRDNADIPVGEFVDVLNEHAEAGRIRAFGGSNWTLGRLAEANAYAARHGRQPLTVLSDNFSLAEMVEPVWPGCVHVSDAASRQWLAETGMANFAWSSQARGFFTDRAGQDKREDASLVRCWYSDLNFRRRARACELAERKGVRPIAIAAAYVLCQPFPSFALIGPRTLHELQTSLGALSVRLTAEELAWLACEDG